MPPCTFSSHYGQLAIMVGQPCGFNKWTVHFKMAAQSSLSCVNTSPIFSSMDMDLSTGQLECLLLRTAHIFSVKFWEICPQIFRNFTMILSHFEFQNSLAVTERSKVKLDPDCYRTARAVKHEFFAFSSPPKTQ